MKARLVLTLLVPVLALVGCQQRDAATDERTFDEKDVLARVNGAPVTEYDLAWWLRSAHTREKTPELRQGAIDKLVEGELIYQKGLELGLQQQEDYRKAIRELEVKLKAAKRAEMMKRVYNQQIAANIKVSPDEVRQYFETNRDRFERVLTFGVLGFDDAAEAQSAKQRIENGEAFETVAKASGEEWKFGPLPWAKIPLEWHEVVYNLEPGEVSEVYTGDRTGIRLFKLLDSKVTDDVAFKDVSTFITNRLRNEKTRRAFNAYLAELKQNADIERLDES